MINPATQSRVSVKSGQVQVAVSAVSAGFLIWRASGEPAAGRYVVVRRFSCTVAK